MQCLSRKNSFGFIPTDQLPPSTGSGASAHHQSYEPHGGGDADAVLSPVPEAETPVNPMDIPDQKLGNVKDHEEEPEHPGLGTTYYDEGDGAGAGATSSNASSGGADSAAKHSDHGAGSEGSGEVSAAQSSSSYDYELSTIEEQPELGYQSDTSEADVMSLRYETEKKPLLVQYSNKNNLSTVAEEDDKDT